MRWGGKKERDDSATDVSAEVLSLPGDTCPSVLKL